jgi:copper resistance protein C
VISPDSPARGRRRGRTLRARLGAAIAGAGVVVASVLLAALPASAHDQLLGTDPADGATVATLPHELTLTFNAVVLESSTGDEIQVTDAAGASLAEGPPKIVDNVVTQRLKGSASGPIRVLWRVVSQDGHPVSGEFGFTVSGAPAPSATATESSAPGPTATSVVSTPAPTTSPAASAGGGSAAPWIILGAVTIAAMAGVGYLLASRARRDRDRPGAAPQPAEGGPGDPVPGSPDGSGPDSGDAADR